MNLFFELPPKEENRNKEVLCINLIFSILLITLSIIGFYSIIFQSFSWVCLIILIASSIMGIQAGTQAYVLIKYLKNKELK